MYSNELRSTLAPYFAYSTTAGKSHFRRMIPCPHRNVRQRSLLGSALGSLETSHNSHRWAGTLL